MGKSKENPRYHVLSLRVTDDERAVIAEAKLLGFTPGNMRTLLLFGARCVSKNPPLPIFTLTLPSSDHPGVL